MPTAETLFTTRSIRFQTSGLILRKDDPERQLWLNAWNDVLELRAFDLPPDIPVRLGDTPGLRGFYESGAQSQNAQIVDLEVRDVRKCQAIWLILKLPARRTGTQYVGSVTLPYQRGSFVMKIQATQVVTTRSSEDAALDASFPDHALSRVRRTLQEFTHTVLLDPALENEPRFGITKPWWKLW